MKKLFSAGVAIVLFFSLLPSLKSQTSVTHSYKTFPIISDEVKKNFIKEFRKIHNEKWFEKEDGYRARFEDDGIKYMVDFDKKGNWLNTIKNYDESHLDKRIGDAVKTAFLGYSIVHITEIKKGKVLTYLVKIENQKLLKTIRMIDGEIDVYEAYIKS